MERPIITRRRLLATTAAAGTFVLPATRASAFLVAGSGKGRQSPIKDITLDNTIFTGSLGAVDALIGQVRTVPSTAVTWSVGGTDGGRFKVVTGSAWQKSPTRIDPTLQTSGAVAGRANGFTINITATPTGGGAAFSKAFSLGPPAAPELQGTVYHISPPSSSAAIQAVIDGASNGDTIYFDPGVFTIASNIILKPGLLFIGSGATLQGTVGNLIVLGAGDVFASSANNCTFYGLRFQRAGINVSSANTLNITNCYFTTESYSGGVNQGCPIFCVLPSNMTISWCTIKNCIGGIKFYSPDATTVDRCAFVDCSQGFGIGPRDNANEGRNVTLTKSYFVGLKRMGVEWHGENIDARMTNSLVADNYLIDWRAPITSDGNSLGLSIVPQFGAGNRILRNFVKAGPNLNTSAYGPGTVGHGYGIEFNSDSPVTVSDNYIIGLGVDPDHLFDAAIYGPYVNVAHVLANNNNYKNNDAYGLGGGTQMGYPAAAIVNGTTHTDLGTPAPFAAGAGP